MRLGTNAKCMRAIGADMLRDASIAARGALRARRAADGRSREIHDAATGRKFFDPDAFPSKAIML